MDHSQERMTAHFALAARGTQRLRMYPFETRERGSPGESTLRIPAPIELSANVAVTSCRRGRRSCADRTGCHPQITTGQKFRGQVNSLLPPIADPVQGALPIIMDSGIRRGMDVDGRGAWADRSPSGGPSGLTVGRPGGIQGVIEYFNREMANTVLHVGANSISALNRTQVRPLAELKRATVRPDLVRPALHSVTACRFT
ncbi:MAG: hypothetical protein GEV05_05065 [Betaproteobacteria bacterium]|nr:hypothetical protein [Betaproteobacteria bacterium]